MHVRVINEWRRILVIVVLFKQTVCMFPALGDQDSDCRTSRYGCCPDGRTPSGGNNNEGCGPTPCDVSNRMLFCHWFSLKHC